MAQHDFDLDRAVEEAWLSFQERLSDAIASMDEPGATLRIDDRESAGPRSHVVCTYVGEARIRAEAALISAPPEVDQRMVQQGWQPTQSPSGAVERMYWVEGTQENSDDVASLVVGALRDCCGVPHPAFLVPDQLAEILTLRTTESALVDDEAEVVPIFAREPEHLQALVALELRRILGHEPLQDADGDFAIRVGSAMVFVRTTLDAKEVIVFSVVVHDVEGRSRAAELLNDLNAQCRYVRFQLLADQVFVQMSVLAHPFVPMHLHQAVTAVTEVADGVDDALAKKLNGRTTFPPQGPPA